MALPCSSNQGSCRTVAPWLYACIRGDRGLGSTIAGLDCFGKEDPMETALELAPVMEESVARTDNDSVRGVAETLYAAYKGGYPFPETAFTKLPAARLQEALLEFARKANISPLDESDLVCKFGGRL